MRLWRGSRDSRRAGDGGAGAPRGEELYALTGQWVTLLKLSRARCPNWVRFAIRELCEKRCRRGFVFRVRVFRPGESGNVPAHLRAEWNIPPWLRVPLRAILVFPPVSRPDGRGGGGGT